MFYLVEIALRHPQHTMYIKLFQNSIHGCFRGLWKSNRSEAHHVQLSDVVHPKQTSSYHLFWTSQFLRFIVPSVSTLPKVVGSKEWHKQSLGWQRGNTSISLLCLVPPSSWCASMCSDWQQLHPPCSSSMTLPAVGSSARPGSLMAAAAVLWLGTVGFWTALVKARR